MTPAELGYTIYVVGVDKLCFWVHHTTLVPYPSRCSYYDAYAISDPPKEASEVISVGTWHLRNALREEADELARVAELVDAKEK